MIRGVEIPVRDKGTKEIAGWCYNQGIHGEAKESHEGVLELLQFEVRR